MWGQISAIFSAHFRTLRNRWPRTHWASLLFSSFGLLWYGFFVVWGVELALRLPQLPVAELQTWGPVALLGVFLFWQTVPLITLSAGASLQLSKIQIYPVPTGALFGIEVLLRTTSSPEMILLLAGGLIGLLRHPSISPLSALSLLLFVPTNLFFSLALREIVLHSFERNRFRELFAILVISIGIIPQFLLRSQLGSHAVAQFTRVATLPFTPWRAGARVALSFHLYDFAVCLAWIAIAFLFARALFRRALRYEETTRGAAGKHSTASGFGVADHLAGTAGMLFADPLGALLWKELRSLIRMPRFRVIFGMACIFSVLIFIPLALNSAGSGSKFFANNFVLIVTLYGLLILSDTLLLNVFGPDGQAAQIYWLAPLPLRVVIWAKNIAAAIFALLQSVLVLAVLLFFRVHVSPVSAADALATELVVLIYFLAAGNLTSVTLARPVDPRQTLRKNAGARMQAWTFLCSLSMIVLSGLAYLARWATGGYGASFAVLAVEFAIGGVVYWISLQTAVQRAFNKREALLGALSKSSSSPV
jgi:ABC-2 type transport system permease protein